MHFVDRLSFVVLNLIITAIVATVGGTIIYLIWDDSVTAMFPNAVSTGVLAAKLTWWQSVKIVWICGVLFKTTIETHKLEDKKTKSPSKFQERINELYKPE